MLHLDYEFILYGTVLENYPETSSGVEYSVQGSFWGQFVRLCYMVLFQLYY